MNPLPSAWMEFATEHAGWLFGLSIASLAMTFVLLPVLVTRLPTDYFHKSRRPSPLSRHLVVHLILTGVKNVIGLTFVVLGVAMLFLPGQGLVTLVIGLTIMNYPGKFALERWIVRRPRVLPALNWLRERHGRPPLDDP